jgi:hypothetical protein
VTNATPAADALSQREAHPHSEQQNGPNNRLLYSNNRMQIFERADGTIEVQYMIHQTTMEISTMSPSVMVHDHGNHVEAGIHTGPDYLEITSDGLFLFQLIHGQPAFRVRHNPLRTKVEKRK